MHRIFTLLLFPAHRRPVGAPVTAGLCLATALLLGGCSSLGVGVGIPLGPFTLGVGANSGGPSLGLGIGIGPFGAGVGVNSGGQVSGNVGVGASVPIGGSAARAGVVVPRAAAPDNTPRY